MQMTPEDELDSLESDVFLLLKQLADSDEDDLALGAALSRTLVASTIQRALVTIFDNSINPFILEIEISPLILDLIGGWENVPDFPCVKHWTLSEHSSFHVRCKLHY